MVCFPGVPAPKQLSLFTCIMSIILTIVTTIGNLSIIVTIIKDPLKKLHTPFNYFLVSLAFSDLIIGVLTMPVSAYVHYAEYMDTLEMVYVKTLHMSYFISATSSLLSLIVLSFDRLFAITKPQKYKKYMGLKFCISVAIGIWIVSLSLPFVYFKWNYIGYLMLFAHSAIIVGLIIMVVTYIRVWKYLKEQNKKMSSHISTSAPESSRQIHDAKQLTFERKITRAFLLILGVFVGVYIPAVIMIYILHFCESCSCVFRHVLRDLQFVLISSNSCMNPFIYAMRVKAFRDSLKALFRGAREAITSSSYTVRTNLESEQAANEMQVK